MPVFRREREPILNSPRPAQTPPTRRPSSPASEPAAKESPAAPVASPVAKESPTALPSAERAQGQETRRAATVPVAREAAAVVDKKTEISGTLHSQGNVLVEGCFEGEIDAKETVWVEQGAQTQAQLHARDVVVSGSFNGEIDCEHRIQITSTATISGEIKAPVLVVEDGATINCRFRMTRSRR